MAHQKTEEEENCDPREGEVGFHFFCAPVFGLLDGNQIRVVFFVPIEFAKPPKKEQREFREGEAEAGGYRHRCRGHRHNSRSRAVQGLVEQRRSKEESKHFREASGG